MSLYLDSSALLKRYVDEPGSDFVVATMDADNSWITAQIACVEVRRNLARVLFGRDLADARDNFIADCKELNIVAVDDVLIEIASTIAETTLARSLDALHLAAATRLGVSTLTFVTFDKRQADVARQLGFSVTGST